MTDQAIPAAFLRLGEPIAKTADGKDIYPTEGFQRLMESLFLRSGGDSDSVFAATQSSARAQGIAIGIRDGTQSIADPNITGIGRLGQRLDAIEANNAQTANSSGGLTATASPTSAGEFGAGALTTNTVTVTPNGGAGGETFAWSIGNPDITINSPSDATTDFSATIAPQGFEQGQATCLVEDTDGATYTVTVPVSFFDPDDGSQPDSGDPIP